MNEIITLEALAERLAHRAGVSTDIARQYITDIQHSLSSGLASSDSPVDMPGVGTFKVFDRRTGAIDFTADSMLAETVNEPFSCFEPVTLTAPIDEIERSAGADIETEPEVSEGVKENEDEPETVVVDAADDVSAPVEPTDDEPVMPARDVMQEPLRTYYRPDNVSEAVSSAGEPAADVSEGEAETTETVPEPEHVADARAVETYEENYDYTDEPRGGMRPIVAYILGILTGMILTCVLAYFLYPSLSTYREYTQAYVPEETEEDVVAVENPDTVASLPEATTVVESAEPAVTTAPEQQASVRESASTNSVGNTDAVTDTIGRKYYLASMARRYYGEMIFWVYIYTENEAHLGHPDRVPPGTVVTIPPASKYGIDRTDPASIERAQREQARIYAKFK